MHVQLNGLKLIFHSNCYADNIICKKKKKKKIHIYIYIYIYICIIIIIIIIIIAE